MTSPADKAAPPSDDALVKALEKRIRHRFRRKSLAVEALSHSSYVNELPAEKRQRLRSYERLELLGDAVLDFLVVEAAFHAHPDWNEGDLSKLRGLLAGETNLVKIAKALRLESLIRLGSGEPKGTVRPSIAADVFEAVLAAVYLDGGWKAARAFALRHFEPDIRRATRQTLDTENPKSRLQEILQSAGIGHPHYRLENAAGPAHAKTFTVVLTLGGRRYTGEGPSIRVAEQAAARAALAKIKQWIHHLHA